MGGKQTSRIHLRPHASRNTFPVAGQETMGLLMLSAKTMISWVALFMLTSSAAQSAAALAPAQLIERAQSAAPADVANGATVTLFDDKGQPTTLRKGTNGWTCVPYDVGTPTRSPLCLNKGGLAWYSAALAGKEPDPNVVGYSYMLKGGSVWSNTDPAATKPAAGKTFVSVPPHVMIMNAKLARESGLPSGEAAPDTAKPFVLLGGTPFAVIILPIAKQ